MTRAQAEEIARTLGQRHMVLYRSQKMLVVNVSRALAVGLPVTDMSLSHDLNAPLLQGGESVSYRKVHVLPAGLT